MVVLEYHDVYSHCLKKNAEIIFGTKNGRVIFLLKNGIVSRIVNFYTTEKITALCLSEDECTLFAGCNDGIIYKYNIFLNKLCPMKYKPNHSSAVLGLHLPPFSDTLFSFSFLPSLNQLSIWCTDRMLPLTCFGKNDDKLFCSSDPTGTFIQIKNHVYIADKLSVGPFELPAKTSMTNSKWRPLCLIPAWLGKDEAGYLVLIEFEDCANPTTLKIDLLPPCDDIFLTLSPNGSFACVIACDSILVYDIAKCALLWTMSIGLFLDEQISETQCANYSIYGKYLCITMGSKLYILKSFCGTLVVIIDHSNFSCCFKDIIFNENENMLVSKSSSGILYLQNNIL